jgi:regulatory protein YycI of two-component signal transduction system YycFG
VKKSKTFTFLNKNRILIQAGLTLIFLLLTLFLSLIFQNKIGSSIINTKIQAVVNKKEAELTESLIQIKQALQKERTFYHFTTSEISQYNSDNLYFMFLIMIR